MIMRELELLAPAANKEVARVAILHGADAVYIGASSHGARRKASNSIEDIAEVVAFAHQFRAKVYVTVNTLVYDEEIPEVERLVADLYRIGVDALIVQDMSLLRMNIPPIQLHASTQCDTRTVEKARFLEDVGFSQLVLARELTIEEISAICRNVSVPVECFIHGALCVSYSGRCQASEACLKRSANRGECAQMCRLPYSLYDADGRILAKDKYLLSLRDFNTSEMIPRLINAGVSSFKIEGRLKDASYVKNVTAAYRAILDKIIKENPDKYCRSSYGTSEIKFTPALDKSFNRGFTKYFLNDRNQRGLASLFTPKSLGEVIYDTRNIHNGDGISFYNSRTGQFDGARVNRVDHGRLVTQGNVKVPSGAELRRTFDVEWQKMMERGTAKRKLWIDIKIDDSGISAKDERGVEVRIAMDAPKLKAEKPMNPRQVFEKTGNTIYTLRNFENRLSADIFIQNSELTRLRRSLITELDRANLASYPFEYRRNEDKTVQYPRPALESADNVANKLAEEFYREHGVSKMDKALEISGQSEHDKQRVVMTTRYCIRRELGCCKKGKKPGHETIENQNLPGVELGGKYLKEPLTLRSGPHDFILDFDCARCEMKVIKQK